ncbi:GIY-YIG nuclease family protein [Halothermothrix orenii]|uniref:Uncharacterized conserved protein n=1 Tax=Halothermothrix orenii (strain H 168 / OCM 544 / DSM 9562) TaxID=373903 RepID=B8D120_HALOH|nr:GIY-YIG nuclease family protein [Halothermothrix orenii]ACL68989.1 uncharacterized conserved protein [Halothermothrix orenii H 168]
MKNLDYDSGIYLLEIFLHKPKKIEVGKKGEFTFPPGYYYYAGTAQKNLQARLERHKRRVKKYHWHIDYLLGAANLLSIYTWEVKREGECHLARYLIDKLNGEIIVPGFGSSDCRCKTHLVFFPQKVTKNEIPDNDFFD